MTFLYITVKYFNLLYWKSHVFQNTFHRNTAQVIDNDKSITEPEIAACIFQPIDKSSNPQQRSGLIVFRDPRISEFNLKLLNAIRELRAMKGCNYQGRMYLRGSVSVIGSAANG